MTPQGRSFEQVLIALGTNEHVASAVRRYRPHDAAIEALEDDIARQHRDLLGDLREVMCRQSAGQVARRMQRDEYLVGTAQL